MRRISLVVIVVALIVGAVPPINAAEPTVTITLTAPRYVDGMRVIAQQGYPYKGWPDDTSWRSTQFRNGRAAVTVPKRRTVGLTFRLDYSHLHRWRYGRQASGAETYVAIRYQGHRAGDAVTPRQARRAEKAAMCWAGTTGDSARVGIRIVQTLVHDDFYGGRGRFTHLAMYASPGLRSVAAMSPVYRGQAGSQNGPWCRNGW